jgi:hypothetical protein
MWYPRLNSKIYYPLMNYHMTTYPQKNNLFIIYGLSHGQPKTNK